MRYQAARIIPIAALLAACSSQSASVQARKPAAAVPSSSQTPTSALLNAPPARFGSAMAYDKADQMVVLFGGQGLAGYLNDTWTWNGRTWDKRNPASSPPARANAAMAYDDAARQLLLFGGSSGVALGDTWVWDGQSWTPRVPSLSPSPRYAAAAEYSASDKKLLLFGGYGGYSGSRLSETWAWDGQTW